MSDLSAEVTPMDNTMNNAAETVYTQTSAALSTGIAEASAGLEKTQAQIKEQLGKAMKQAEAVATFNQGTVEAAMKSGQIWVAGVQGLSKQFAATAQTQLDETVSVFKTLTGLRSLKDLMDLQASFARSSVEKAMSETGRFTDAGFKLAEEALAPLTARVSLAVETFAKPAA